jgi:hypothetical protein
MNAEPRKSEYKLCGMKNGEDRPYSTADCCETR